MTSDPTPSGDPGDPRPPAVEYAVPDLLSQLIAGEDLDADQAHWVMAQVMSGDLPPTQLAGILVALAAKGESAAELLGFSEAMIEAAVPLPVAGPSVDIVGTGGDRHRSVNISTMAALVVAGAGLQVVKHGNRAASSASGAADVLEALGVRLDVPPERVAALAREVGITFAFAAVFHPAMRHAGPTRSALGVRTIFNVLGPLTNPSQPRASAIGVANAAMAPLMAQVFAARGASVLLYRSHDGLDEWATTAPATVWEIANGTVTEHVIDAAEVFEMAPATLAELRGADAAYNAEVVRRVLAGERGPIRDAVLLGAAAAITADGSLVGDGTLVERMREALVVAADAIDTGAATDALDRWVAASRASG